MYQQFEQNDLQIQIQTDPNLVKIVTCFTELTQPYILV